MSVPMWQRNWCIASYRTDQALLRSAECNIDLTETSICAHLETYIPAKQMTAGQSISELRSVLMAFKFERMRLSLMLSVQTHQTTGHIAYSGSMVDLTGALTSLPSGGQCIMSGQTYHRALPQLQALAEDRLQKVQVNSTGQLACPSIALLMF